MTWSLLLLFSLATYRCLKDPRGCVDGLHEDRVGWVTVPQRSTSHYGDRTDSSHPPSRIDGNVEGNAALGSNGQDHYQAGWTLVEGIGRYHQCRASAGLFVTGGGAKVYQPDVPAGRQEAAHGSSSPSDRVASQARRSSSRAS